jgi:hypothetical protein
MKSIFLLILLTLASLQHYANAGARGFEVAFIDISEKPYDDGKQVAMILRNDKNFLNKNPDCTFCENSDDAPGQVGVLYAENLPKGITKDIAQAAVYRKNINAIKELRKSMVDFKDSANNVDGLDGVYIYSRDKVGVTIYAIGSRSKNYKFESAFHPVKNYISNASLDELFLKTSKAFWVGFQL